MEKNNNTMNSIDKQITIENSLFLIFAEYMGYVSGVVSWAEDYLNGKSTPSFKIKVINQDALCLLSQIKRKYTNEEISSWYKSFKDIVPSDIREKVLKAKSI